MEPRKIRKRDGSLEDFDINKPIEAIKKAFSENGYTFPTGERYYEMYDELAWETNFSGSGEIPTVEMVQDIVENLLIDWGYRQVAKEYIRYRYIHQLMREHKMQEEFTDKIGEKLFAKDVQNQNANVDEHSFGGRIGETANVVMEDYVLRNCISEMARNNHLNNEIYIHDLSHYAVGDHNCLSIPFDDLLRDGFNTRQTDIRPAQSVSTAFQLVAVIFQLQSLQQFGGVSATHLDWTMVPYVRKSFFKHFKDGMRYIESEYIEDKDYEPISDLPINDIKYTSNQKAYNYAMDKTYQEIKQSVEGMYHNLNTLQSRSGNQLPFTSINYGTCTLPEGRMVIKALLEGSIKGVGKVGRTSIFPCGIFQCMNGVNRHPGDPNYDLFQLAIKSTAQRLYPNYANVDWSGNAGYDRNDPRTYFSTIN